MIGRDLDDAPLPAEVYVLWEGLLATPSSRFSVKRFHRRLRWRGPRAALALYETNKAAVQTLWDLWEQDQPVAVVTYLPVGVVAALADRLDRESVPNTRLVVSQPRDMSRLIALLNDVARIFHGFPEHNLLYGPKGFLVPPQSPELMREVL
ncbi:MULTISPECIES: hypothetical protein [unclassified Streptomyces]|uniref:hypothetical protein n=1 Tax=unclassified Streptomyces TaxID=2593676 RepID=UPI002E2AE759|nr:hypothetical protein [Streptomyces sp. NBC_00285]